MELKQKVLGFIRHQKLIVPGTTIILGVSGGLDSVVLAHLMCQLRHDLSMTLHMAHFNHRLRRSSGKDEDFVKILAARLNVPLTVGSRPKMILKKKVSEEQARQWRFKFFIGLSHRLKADAVALAHTQNDLAETVLMRLIRGSGIYGLRAILAEREIEGMRVIRPLLDISRKEIETYIRQWKLEYCVDETNMKMHFLRNKIRLSLLPHLTKEYNPHISSVLTDLAKTAGDDYDFLRQELLERIKENVVSSQRTVRIKAVFLRSQHASMKRLLMRYAFEHLTGDGGEMTYAHIVQTEELLEQRPSGSIVHWPRSVRVIKKKDCLEFLI